MTSTNEHCDCGAIDTERLGHEKFCATNEHTQADRERRPSLRCFEERPRCMDCPCTRCGQPFDSNVEHAGKDSPAGMGEISTHFYDHPSIHMINLIDRREAAVRAAAYRDAADAVSDLNAKSYTEWKDIRSALDMLAATLRAKAQG